MKHFFIAGILLSSFLTLVPNLGFAEDKKTQHDLKKDDSKNDKMSSEKQLNEIDKVMSEYKQYLISIPEDVVNEVKKFRKEKKELTRKLNKERKKLFETLSNKAKDYLKVEKEYKEKLTRIKEKGKHNNNDK